MMLKRIPVGVGVLIGCIGAANFTLSAETAPSIPAWMQPLPSAEDFHRYSQLGSPFDCWETYHSAFPWTPTAEILLTVVPEGDVQRVDIKQAERAIKALLEPYRGKNPNAFTCFNFDAAVEGWEQADRVRLRAGLFAVQKLGLLEPIDVLLEYSRVQILDLPLGGGMIPEFVIFQSMPLVNPAISDTRYRQAYPVLQGIAGAPERSLPVLLRTANETTERPSIRFRAACYVAHLAPERLAEINNTDPGDDAAAQLVHSGFSRLQKLKKIESHWADRIGYELFEMEK